MLKVLVCAILLTAVTDASKVKKKQPPSKLSLSTQDATSQPEGVFEGASDGSGRQPVPRTLPPTALRSSPEDNPSPRLGDSSHLSDEERDQPRSSRSPKRQLNPMRRSTSPRYVSFSSSIPILASTSPHSPEPSAGHGLFSDLDLDEEDDSLLRPNSSDNPEHSPAIPDTPDVNMAFVHPIPPDVIYHLRDRIVIHQGMITDPVDLDRFPQILSNGP